MGRRAWIRAWPLWCALTIAACGPAPEGATREVLDAACVADFEVGVDYYPAKAELGHAQYFSLTYHEHYKVLRAHMPATNWGPELSDVVVLNRCGTPVPPLEGDLAGALVIETPVQRFATNSLASALRLRMLGLEDRIVAMPGSPFDSVLAARAADGGAASVGSHGTPDLERLMTRRAEVLVLFTSSLEHSAGIDDSRSLGIGGIPLLSWAEPTYLGQAEWIKHHAALFDAEQEAEAFFRDVEARYLALAQSVEGVTPVGVLWATPTASDRWWVEAGNWQDEVLRAAGGLNVFQAGPGESSIVVDSERIIAEGNRAAVWITNLPDPGSLTLPAVFEEIAAWPAGRSWHVHRQADAQRNAFDWSETPFVRPDLVLTDLISVLHPGVLPEHEPRFLAPLKSGNRTTGRTP